MGERRIAALRSRSIHQSRRRARAVSHLPLAPPRAFRIPAPASRSGGCAADAWSAHTDGDRLQLELSFESFDDARGKLLAMGRGVEVLAPGAPRRNILDHAGQIVDLYSG